VVQQPPVIYQFHLRKLSLLRLAQITPRQKKLVP
jgi:hypothetical protein